MKNTLTSKEYRALCQRVLKAFRTSHNISILGAAESADLVMWGEITETDLFDWFNEDPTPINR